MSAEEDLIANASGRILEDRFFDLAKRYESSGIWIPRQSPFAEEQVLGKRRKSFDFDAMKPGIRESLLDYLAASSFLHCVDAWTYFGRALSAMSTGSFSVAQHLLYYSELRSALSVLARNGIFNIDSQNFTLSADGKLEHLADLGTHAAVWKQLRSWSLTPTSAAAVSGSIKFFDSTMDEWLDTRYDIASATSVVPTLFAGWGVDLNMYSRDQRWRNHNSYGPQHVRENLEIQSPDWINQTLSDIWSLLASDGTSTFVEMDVQLLRSGLRHAYALHHGTELGASIKFDRLSSKIIEELVAPAFVDRAHSLISERSNPSSLTMRFAGLRPNLRITPGISTRGMAGRAAILLRFATSGTETYLRDSGVHAEGMARWCGDLFTRTGVAREGDGISDFIDSQANLEITLAELRARTDGATIDALARMEPEWISQVHDLTKVERALVWSLVA